MIREAVDNIHHHLVYPTLVSGDAQKNREIAHDRILKLLQQIEKRPLLRAALNQVFTYRDPKLQATVAGLTFESPLGIAAGLDKNGVAPNAICALGFSHIEIGTVTPQPQIGAAQPRVFALPESGAMINRMGFPSEGMDFVFEQLDNNKVDSNKIRGINIGANLESVRREKAIDDYSNIASRLLGRARYLTLNISSPNTKGLRNLQNEETLRTLLDEVRSVIEGRRMTLRFFAQLDKDHQIPLESIRTIPLFIKIAPDLTAKQVDQVLKVCIDKANGIIVANTTTDPKVKATLNGPFNLEDGGVSGKPLTQKALKLSHFIFEETGGKLPIIRSGGVMTEKDYWDALTYGGASLVQLYTAFIDRQTSTPNLAYYMNRGIVERMEELGIENLEGIRGMQESAIHNWAVR